MLLRSIMARAFLRLFPRFFLTAPRVHREKSLRFANPFRANLSDAEAYTDAETTDR